MRQIYIVIMIFIFAIAPVTFVSTANANSVLIYRTGWIPLETTSVNNCNQEPIAFTGMTYTQLTIIEDGSGGIELHSTGRTRGTAIGLVTGAKYIVSGDGWSADTTHSSAFNGTFVGNLQMNGEFISLDRSVPDMRYKVSEHITLDANGNIKSFFENFEIFCR